MTESTQPAFGRETKFALSRTPLILFGLAVLTRLPFTSRFLYGHDSVQFALGMERFDITLHQPHPPGYFLYVISGRLAKVLTGDANTALILVSVITGALTVALIYCLGREVFGERAGLAAGILALFSPLMWFYGEVALSYMPEALMSVSLAYVCYRVLEGETGLYWLTAVILGISGGIRQNAMVFLVPLWLYSMKGVGIRRFVLGGLIVCLTVAAWFLPMVSATGGYAAYSSALRSIWVGVVWHGMDVARMLRNAAYVTYFASYTLGVALVPLLALLLLRLRGKVRLPWDGNKAAFFIVWLAPGALFHVLIYFQRFAAGYVLIYGVGLLVLSGQALTAAAEAASGGLSSPLASKIRLALLVFVVAANASFYIFGPDPYTARGIGEHDRELGSYIRAVRAGFFPDDTEIIGTDRLIWSYRHAMYYLPEYRVHSNHYLSTPDGPRLFCGKDGKTRRESRIELSPGTRHVIFFMPFVGDDRCFLPKEAKFERFCGDLSLAHIDEPKDPRWGDWISPLMVSEKAE